MKKTKRILWIVVALVVVSLIALPKILGKKGPDGAAQQPRGQTALQTANVTAIVVTPRPFQQTLTVPGSILANEQVQLKAETSGRIVKLALREGAEAKKGDLLVKINDADLQAQLEKAQAALKLAQNREKRQRSLLEKELISQEEHDIAQAGLTAGIADIDLLKALIAKTEIRAPFDGRVGLKLVSEGAFLSVGSPVADFVKVTPLKIEFSVPERYAGAVALGNSLTFTVHGSKTAYAAKVYARQSAIDEATRTLRVRALCSDAGKNVLPGAFAEVRISLGKNDRTIMVPTQAIVPDMKGQNVFLVKDGKSVKKPVETGERTGLDVQIIKGLS
ncbi:MAG: efflux RND transporter periplasmic adaptor subunit, partial [Chitinispirillaceae bacterium]|nr:efflux RND transporter periplasmic adaptor subunit [Chitinispirillaceae bacterium]